MADLTADPIAVHRLVASAGLAARPTVRPAPPLPEVIGRQAGALGVGAPFGQMEAPALAVLAEVAARHAGGDIRLTPFRAVLLPAIADAATAETALAAAGFITDPADPRRAVVACTGAPGCASGLQPARRDAALLAPLAHEFGPGLQLHVSGCAKGCARPSATPVTLVGTARGYDLVLDGKPGDRPRTKGLTRADLAAALARLERP
jgi:precorrin-3B synthase